MKNNTAKLLAILTIIALAATSATQNASSLEEWFPYVPSSDAVELCYLAQNGISYVNVSITFASSGFNISDWGTPIFDGSGISVDAKIWRWTGVSLPVVVNVSHMYNLGLLRPGEYNFTFKVWSYSVETITFKVAPKILLTTDKPLYKLGENVTITLTNIGEETVTIGGYPAWQIYTYPEEKPVYPAVYAFLIWQLEPGENDTFVWNQLNEFTNTPCAPGTYLIRDVKGWGLFTYFSIIAEAINATVEIFPRSLNLRSTGLWITAYIELPEGYDVADIEVSSIKLNETIPSSPEPSAICDYDQDGVPDLMVKFDRRKVISYICAHLDVEEFLQKRFATLTLKVTGNLVNGHLFQGFATLRITWTWGLHGTVYSL